MTAATASLEVAALRRYVVAHQGFATRFRRARLGDVEAEIRRISAVQLDSLADVIGSLQDRDLLDRVFKNPDALHDDVAAAMQPPLAAIDADEKLDEVFSTLSGGRANAVVVAEGGKPIGVLTRTDLLEYLAHRR